MKIVCPSCNLCKQMIVGYACASLHQKRMLECMLSCINSIVYHIRQQTYKARLFLFQIVRDKNLCTLLWHVVAWYVEIGHVQQKSWNKK
jgi:hypothetical protein